MKIHVQNELIIKYACEYGTNTNKKDSCVFAMCRSYVLSSNTWLTGPMQIYPYTTSLSVQPFLRQFVHLIRQMAPINILSNTWFLSPICDIITRRASWVSLTFLQGSRSWPTNTHTHSPHYVQNLHQLPTSSTACLQCWRCWLKNLKALVILASVGSTEYSQNRKASEGSSAKVTATVS